MTITPDPRPSYALALEWVRGLIAEVRPAQLDGPTPCPDLDVRALLGHLVATVDRARVIGEGGDANAMPVVVEGVPDAGWVDAHLAAGAKMWTIWTDDAMLDATVTAPWATIPGRAAVWAYVNETLVHGWDLAVATGQDPEADAALAEAALVGAVRSIAAEPRGGFVPIGPVVEPAADAGPTERLANWSGHHRPLNT